MRWSRFAVFVLIVTVLQASVADIFAVTHLNIKPDLLLILLVFFSIYSGTTEAIITSFTIGFAADIIGAAIGPQMLSFGIFGTLLAYLHRVIAIRKFVYKSIAIFITGFLSGVLAHFLTYLKGEPSPSDVYAILFGTCLYSSLVGPFLFLPSAWWMRMKTGRFGRRRL